MQTKREIKSKRNQGVEKRHRRRKNALKPGRPIGVCKGQFSLDNKKEEIIQLLKQNMPITYIAAEMRFLTNQSLSAEELPRLFELMNRLIDDLRAKNWSDDEIRHIFKKKAKKLYYHTRSLKGQWILLQKSSFNQFFELPLYWRFLCFITRGVFK